MNGALTSLIAVAGTLLGSTLTYVFQRRTADRVEQLTRGRMMREERLAAFSEFAGAIMDLRRGEYDRWHRSREDANGDAARAARDQAYRVRTTAYQAQIRVQLITESPALLALAEETLRLTDTIHDADDSEALAVAGEHARHALHEFVQAAKAHVG